MFVLSFWIALVVIYALIVLPLHYLVYGGGETLDDTLMIPSVAYLLFVMVPFFSVYVRRLHDIGRSGWWILLHLIPVIGPITLLVFTVLDSQPGDNAYGPNPKKAVY